jgi:hypothetical protein
MGTCGKSWKIHELRTNFNWEPHHLTFLHTFQDFDAGAKFQASLSDGLSGDFGKPPLNVGCEIPTENAGLSKGIWVCVKMLCTPTPNG